MTTWYSPREVAQFFNVVQGTIYDWMNKGMIEAEQYAAHPFYRISDTAIERLIASHPFLLDHQEWLGLSEAARMVGIHPNTMGDRVRSGEVPARRYGRNWYVRRSDAARTRGRHVRLPVWREA